MKRWWPWSKQSRGRNIIWISAELCVYNGVLLWHNIVLYAMAYSHNHTSTVIAFLYTNDIAACLSQWAVCFKNSYHDSVPLWIFIHNSQEVETSSWYYYEYWHCACVVTNFVKPWIVYWGDSLAPHSTLQCLLWAIGLTVVHHTHEIHVYILLLHGFFIATAKKLLHTCLSQAQATV